MIGSRFNKTIGVVEALQERFELDGLVFITHHPELVKEKYLGQDRVVYIAVSRWQLLRYRKKTLGLPEQNIQIISIRRMNEEFLKDKVIACFDCPFLAMFLSQKFRQTLNITPLSLSFVSNSRLWKLLTLKRSLLLGNLPDDESIFVLLGGRLSNVHASKYPIQPVLAIVTQFNEVDIIEPTIRHLVGQGCDVHVIDNWSDDGSYEAVQNLAKKYPKRVALERFPTNETGKYEWRQILKRVEKVAKSKPQYKWIISNDADEIRFSPWPGVTLQQALSFIDSIGYNCIDYTVFNFKPVKDGFSRGDDPKNFFEYGEFGAENWYFMQLKTWRNHPDAEIASSGGHLVEFPGRRIFPFKFFLGHYSLRSTAQARKKIFKDRQPRFVKDEKDEGWHVQYDNVDKNKKFIVSQNGLVNFAAKDFWQKYLFQRLFGIGINKK